MSGNENRRLLALEKRTARLDVRDDEEVFDARPYRDDPIGFHVGPLGCESATRRSDGTNYQHEIMAAVRDHPRTAVVSGHGCGKTHTLAAIALWWLITRPFSKVIIVAPQFDRQVRGVIFAELRKLARRAKIQLPVEVQAGRVVVDGYGAEWSALGMPATDPDRIEGQHADGGLLLIMDETKGIGQDVFDALQGALTGGDDSRLLIASTPGGPSGPFFRACSDESGHWKLIRLSSEDSSIVSPQWCADRAHEWGKDSALYQTRVVGLFADAGDGQLFPLSILESAIGRKVEAGAVALGIDVARSVAGDQNCICVASGGRVERFSLWRSPDTMATVQRGVHEALMTKAKTIVVDVTGVGAGVADRLRQLRYNVIDMNFGGAANDPTRFANKRAELYFTLRERLEKGEVSLPDEEELLADLAAIRFSFDPRGRVVIEPKDEARKRLGRSPDRGDSLALAVAAQGLVPAPRIVAPYTVEATPFYEVG